MRIIECVRGGQRKPLILNNDTFDSVINLYDKYGTIIDTIYNVNTDFHNGYKGGILKEGTYFFICGLRKDTGKKVFYLTNRLIEDISKMREKDRIFPSLIANPNHNMKYIITQLLIHGDGWQGGWSHGCITVYPAQWDKLIDKCNIGEFGVFKLIRDPNWAAPKIYQGN
jgi:hypothetical protein